MNKSNHSELVKVTHFVNPHLFWIDRVEETDYEFQQFQIRLQKFAKSASTCIPEIRTVIAVLEEGTWKRAEVETEWEINKIKRLPRHKDAYEVWLVDEGRPAHVDTLPRSLSSRYREKEARVEKTALYGILPSTKEFNYIKNCFETCKTDKWCNASTTLVCRLFNIEGVKIYFRTRKSLDTTTIGDVIVETPDGNQIDVTAFLCNKGLAIQNEFEFLEDLYENKLIHITDPLVCRITSSYIINSRSSSRSDLSKREQNKSMDSDINVRSQDMNSLTNSNPALSNSKVSGSLKNYVDMEDILDYESSVSFQLSRKSTPNKLKENSSENSDPSPELIQETQLRRSVGRGRKKRAIKEDLNVSSDSFSDKEKFETKVSAGRGIKVIQSSQKVRESSLNFPDETVGVESSNQGISNRLIQLSNIRCRKFQEFEPLKVTIKNKTDDLSTKRSVSMVENILSTELKLESGKKSSLDNKEDKPFVNETDVSNSTKEIETPNFNIPDKHNINRQKEILSDVSLIPERKQLQNDSKNTKFEPEIIIGESLAESDDAFLLRMKRKEEEKALKLAQILSLNKKIPEQNQDRHSIEKQNETEKESPGKLTKTLSKLKFMKTRRTSESDSSKNISSDESMEDCKQVHASSKYKSDSIKNRLQQLDEIEQRNLEEEIKWPTMNNSSQKIEQLKIIPSGFNINNNNSTKKDCHKNRNRQSETSDTYTNNGPMHNTSDRQSIGSSVDSESDDQLIIKLEVMKKKRQILIGKNWSARLTEADGSIQNIRPRLLVHAPMNIVRIQNINSAPFCKSIIRSLQTLGFDPLKSIQSYAWNGISRGQNLVAVHAFSNNPLAVKYEIMTFLPPLCDILLQSDFRELGPGCGPFALILCPSKTAVKRVNDFAINMVNTFKQEEKPRIAFIVNTNIMISSCSLLITTPRCFLKRFQTGGPLGRITNLKRLCQLVLYKADILFDRYATELNDILQICHKVLKERPVGHNLQFIATSEHWTRNLENMCKHTPVNPIIIIKPPIEAALYGRVNIKLHFISGDKKVAQMTEILEKKYTLFRTLIVCNVEQEISDIYTYMEASGFKVLRVNEETSKVDIERVVSNWSKTVPGSHSILLATDILLADVHLLKTDWLIHYSLPDSWSHFSYRFFTFTDNYENPLNQINPSKPPCESHIFIDQENTMQIPRMVNFLKRMKVKIPVHLTETNEKLIHEREVQLSINKVPLCHTLASWGECSLGINCKYRHKFFSNCDKPLLNMPIGSNVKLRLLHFHDVVYFSARLLDTNCEQYAILAIEMSKYFSKNNRPASDISFSKLYAVNNDGLYQRCEILMMDHFKDAVKVKLIDDGAVLFKKKIDLMSLPEELSKIPPQVIDVYISGLKPADDEIEWDSTGRMRINNLLTKYEVEKSTCYLYGTVTLVLGTKIWIDDIRLCEEFKINKAVIDKLNIKNTLIKENIAMKNPNHITILYALCTEGGIEIKLDSIKNNDNVKKQKNTWKKIQNAHMEVGGKFERVHFLSTGEDNKFYLAYTKYDDLLGNLMAEIEKKIIESIYPTEVDYSEGTFCIVFDQNQDRYFRAKILTYKKDVSSVECWLIDEAYTILIDDNYLWPVESWMLDKLPAQAIICRLFGVNCNSEEDLIYYEGSPDLWARCVRKDPDNIYCVLLQERTDTNDYINLRLCESNSENQITTEVVIETDFLVDEEKEYSDSSDFEEDIKQNVCEEELESNDIKGDLEMEFSEDDMDAICRAVFKIPQEIVSARKLLPDNPPEELNQSQEEPEREYLKISRSNDLVESIKTEMYTPTVFWYQTPKLIILKIQLADVKICEVSLEDNVLNFSTKYQSKNYGFNLKLYNLVDEKEMFYEARGLEVYVELQKMTEGEKWPRLLQSKQRCRYIKADLDHEISDSESDDGKVKPCLQALGKVNDVESNVDSDEQSETEFDFGSDENDSSDYISDKYEDI